MDYPDDVMKAAREAVATEFPKVGPRLVQAAARAIMAERERMEASISAARGYLMNAKIDLETGAPKKTAIATIEGGLRRLEAAAIRKGE